MPCLNSHIFSPRQNGLTVKPSKSALGTPSNFVQQPALTPKWNTLPWHNGAVPNCIPLHDDIPNTWYHRSSAVWYLTMCEILDQMFWKKQIQTYLMEQTTNNVKESCSSQYWAWGVGQTYLNWGTIECPQMWALSRLGTGEWNLCESDDKNSIGVQMSLPRLSQWETSHVFSCDGT